MKFVCDQCGKKYATSQDPAPGKVYKLKCTDCGHLIVVKSQAGTSTALPVSPEVEATASGLASAPPPALGTLLFGGNDPLPEAEDGPPSEPFAKRLGDSWDDLPAEVSGNLRLPVPSGVPAPPPPDKDELADFAAAAAEVIGTGSPAGRDDPFMAAARASLPVGSGDRAARAVEAATARPPAEPDRSAPSGKSRPRSEKEGGLPIAAIGFGVVVMIVITTIAVLQGKKSEPVSPPPAVAAALPAPAPTPASAEPAPAPAATPAPEPPRAEPAPEPPRPEPKEPAAARRAEPRPAPPERRAEARPAPPRPEPRPAPAAAVVPPPEPETRLEPREPTLPEGPTVLTPEVVQKVVSANRRAFGACIAKAADSDVKLDGRQVALRITVAPSGSVSYPTLDDASLNGTEMGQCLKSAARLMIFPKFRGDQFHIEVPLVLSAP